MVKRGLADSDAGRTISNNEMDRRIRSWQKPDGNIDVLGVFHAALDMDRYLLA
jgi:hypothetical protein